MMEKEGPRGLDRRRIQRGRGDGTKTTLLDFRASGGERARGKKGVDTGELGAFQKSPLSPAAVGRGGVGLSVGERAAEIKQPFELPLFPPLSLSRYLTACLLPLLSSPPPPPS